MYKDDKRIIITLDAGGTNFVFGAIQSNNFITAPVTLPSRADDLDACLKQMVTGFQTVIDALPAPAVAISFAFPGPADYPNGIIGGYLPNFPSFRKGVALKAFLERKFGLPVYINNDGDLYAYGEALAGMLPDLNARLEALGSNKRFHNLLGYTFGTGFGFGHVTDGVLHLGDNSCADTFSLRHKKIGDMIVEEGVSIRALKRLYAQYSHDRTGVLEPVDICHIAEGVREGDREAAVRAFDEFGEIAGDAIATAVTLIDGVVVIGGGLTGARRYYMPALLREMRSQLRTFSGDTLNRLQETVYDLDDAQQFEAFARGEERRLQIYGSNDYVIYDPQNRTGVATSRIGANKAISLGAYAFALHALDTL